MEINTQNSEYQNNEVVNNQNVTASDLHLIEELKAKVISLESENKQLSNNYNEIVALHSSVIDNSLDGTLITDYDYNILYTNSVITDIFGHSEKDLAGHDLREYIYIKDLFNVEEFCDTIKLQHNNNNTNNKSTNSNKSTSNKLEFQIIHSLKQLRYVFVSISYTYDFQGNKALIFQILDITDIKAAERKVVELNQELEQRVVERTTQLQEALGELKIEMAIRQRTEEELKKAKEEVTNALEQEKELNTLKSRFISMISHEYRTPLTVILTSTYLIEQYYEGPQREQFDKFIFKIRASVKSMVHLLEDVLTIGRSEAGKHKNNLDKILFVDFIKEIIEEVQVIDNNEHIFEFNYPEFSVELISDVSSLKHIVSNLMVNSAKYSPGKDKVIINLLDMKDKVLFEIIDFGIGIPEDDHTLLFEAFHRASNVGAISGTGLGLSIVKRFVDGIEGTIFFESEKNKGTKFSVIIPKKLKL